eukprot:TRINITY_DN42161_c0_g1_i1.p1 TRINITY_DN42161_c0_g1~~TRINITY_DN42161_c0_g1_i1.p1  ORF type:complete len:239 (+),score=16.29 TRINITY_DN42161_c0_g1_i1:63-719(+)
MALRLGFGGVVRHRTLQNRLHVVMVQRPRWRPRHLSRASIHARSWSRFFAFAAPPAGFRGSPNVVVWRPEEMSVTEQFRRLLRTDIFAAVTGQACGLAALLPPGRVLLEFTPALNGPYRCEKGWDMNPTSEVGQIGRLATVYHRCIMVGYDGIAAADDGASEITPEVLRSLSWRVATGVILPPLRAPFGRGLGRIFREALKLVAASRMSAETGRSMLT